MFAYDTKLICFLTDAYNKREINLGSKLIVDMNGNSTTLKNPQNMSEKGREFHFDFSYWSHDGFKEKPDGYMEADPSQPNGKKYADQVWF